MAAWIIRVWQCVSLEVAVKGCKKWCIFSAVDGTYDDMLCNNSEEGGSVRSGGFCECCYESSVSIMFHVN